MKEEKDLLLIHQDGTVEVELRTITENELRYNDLRIFYLPASNIIVVQEDNFQKDYRVIEKGKSVRFKVKNEFGNPNRIPELKIFDTENMELE